MNMYKIVSQLLVIITWVQALRQPRQFLCMKKSKEKALAPLYNPRTHNQKEYVNALNNPDNKLIIGTGPAGSGKTLFACIHAMQELKRDNIEKIIITRPIVTVEEDLGYLPGKLNNKMEPWTRPIFDIFAEYYDHRSIQTMVQSNVIEIAPLAYMRGRTFKNAIVIADEMQNSSPNQMFMTATRLGYNSQLIVTGDLNQSDRQENNGLRDIIEKISRAKSQSQTQTQTQTNTSQPQNSNIEMIQFNNTDIQRSPIVSRIIDIYEPKKPMFKATIPEVIKMKLENATKQINTTKSTTNPKSKQTNTTKTTKKTKQIKSTSKKTPRGNEDAAMIPKSQMHSTYRATNKKYD
jgi:phosphate starvation-inducible protein PhoH and related proteins